MSDLCPSNPSSTKTNWLTTLKVYCEPASLRMLALGFSAGLPLLLVLGTLSFRLREAGVDLTTIGYLSWVGLAYGFKWVWSPLVDRMPVPILTPRLGRRRSWLLLAQIAIAGGLVGMALCDPKTNLHAVAWLALLVAFASATQDIALDAFRIESADVVRQGALAATYQTGYRIAMIWAGAGVLLIAAGAEVPNTSTYQHAAWQTAYLVMAASMAVGMVTVLLSPEPTAGTRDTQAHAQATEATHARFAATGVPLFGVVLLASLLGMLLWAVIAPTMALVAWSLITGLYMLPLALYALLLTGLARTGMRIPLPARLLPAAVWFTHAFFLPFADFFRRYGKKAALILALVAMYRISDVVMGIVANAFYVDMGFTKVEIASVTKVYGVIMTLAGAFIGGLLSLRLGVMRVLMLGAVLSAASNVLFAGLARYGHDVQALVVVVSADNLAAGIASAAFIAYLSGLTNIAFSATQYALLSSLMLMLPKFIAGFSGAFASHYGYETFFISTAALGLPVLVLIAWASRTIPHESRQTI